MSFCHVKTIKKRKGNFKYYAFEITELFVQFCGYKSNRILGKISNLDEQNFFEKFEEEKGSGQNF